MNSSIHTTLSGAQKYEVASQLARENDRKWTRIHEHLASHIGNRVDEGALRSVVGNNAADIHLCRHLVGILCGYGIKMQDFVDILVNLKFTETLQYLHSSLPHLQIPLIPEPYSHPPKQVQTDEKLEMLIARVEKMEQTIDELTNPKPKKGSDPTLLSSLEECVILDMAKFIAGSACDYYKYMGLYFGSYNVRFTEKFIEGLVGPDAVPLTIVKKMLDILVDAGVTKTDFAHVMACKIQFPLFVKEFSHQLQI